MRGAQPHGLQGRGDAAVAGQHDDVDRRVELSQLTEEGEAAAVAARVGEPFFTTRPPGQGLGLGVFLARAFVEQTGGEMTLTSAPGKGTRVLMRWPLPT